MGLMSRQHTVHSLSIQSWVRFCQQEFGEFPWPAWAVGSYSNGRPAGGTPQILVDKTSPKTGRQRVYVIMYAYLLVPSGGTSAEKRIPSSTGESSVDSETNASEGITFNGILNVRLINSLCGWFAKVYTGTGWMEWMSHRKWRETKQQPSMLPGPAVPGCCLVYLCFLCNIYSIHSVYLNQT